MDILIQIFNFLKYVLLGIASFLVGIVFLAIYYQFPQIAFHDYYKDIGIGFLTASAIIIIIESYQRIRSDAERRQFFIDLGKGASYALYHTIIPESITKQFVEQVISKDFLRTDYSITYNLSDTSDSPDVIDGMIEIEYHVKNLTFSEKKHNIHLNFKKDLLVDKGKSITVYEIGILRRGRDWEFLKIDDFLKANDENHFKFSMETNVASEEIIKVSEKFGLLFPLTYRDVWFSSDPIENINFRIKYPANRLEVGAVILHPSRDKFRTSLRVSRQGDKRWCLNEGIFPFQPIEFWWRPK